MDYYNFTRLLYNITNGSCYIGIDSSLNNITPYLLKIAEYCLYILIVIYINLSYEIYKRDF